MARHQLSKEELRDDPLKDWFFYATDYVYRRRTLFLIGGGFLLALVVAGAAAFVGLRWSNERMAARFNEAESLAMSTRSDVEANQAKAREMFKAFVADYPSGALTPYAWMHLAQAAALAGQSEESEKTLRQVVDLRSSPASLRAIAANSLAKIYEDQGAWNKAAELYKSLPAESFGDLAEFSLGRVAVAENKPNEARDHYKAVAEQHPLSSLAALARDVLNFVHD